LQLHQNRSEKWFVLNGKGLAYVDGKHLLCPDTEIFIPKTKPHRLEAITDLTILEISNGLFDELDIIRLEDDYHRES